MSQSEINSRPSPLANDLPHWQSEQSLRLVLESLREHAVLTTDPSGIITSWHANAEGLLGWTASEVLGQDANIIFTPEDRSKGIDRSEMTQASANGRTADERWHVRKDGTRFWGSGMVYPLQDDSGQLVGFVRILTNRTEEHLRQQQTQSRKEELEHAFTRKAAELRASDERWRATFDRAAMGICLCDPVTGRFLEVNAALCEQLGYSLDELRMRTFYDITHPDDLVENRSRFQDLVTERVPAYTFTKRLIRRNGSCVWVNTSVSLVRDGEGRPLHSIAVVEDITGRVNAEQALRNTNDELRKANNELEQFAYVSSHDLQEPLRTISVYTQMFLRRYDTSQDAVGKQYGDYILENVSRMQHLIDDLLEYSRAVHTEKHEQYRSQPVDLNAAIQDALTMLHHHIHDFHAVVTYDRLPVVQADYGLLAQVFQNLISNALKFRHPDRAPQIHVSATNHKDEAIISVEDNGIGFEEKYAERIFGLFKRLHRSEYPGTGLGLALSKRTINRYGGRIWAKSELGKGSTFFFALPRV